MVTNTPARFFIDSCTGDKCGQAIRFDLERDANRICALFDEEPVQQFRGTWPVVSGSPTKP
jgi:hypothetical protein